MSWVDEWRKTPPSPNAGEVVSTNWPTAGTHRDLPVPDEALMAARTCLTAEHGWLSPYTGPSGSDLDRYCGADGKVADLAGLQAADSAADDANLASLRQALLPVVAAVLREEADRIATAIPETRPQEDSSFYWGVDEFADQLRARADQLDPR